MRSYLAPVVVPLLASAALLFGCAKASSGDPGTGGSTGAGNSTGSGSAGTTGTGNTTGTGTGNSTGSGTAGSSATGTAGSTGACTPGDPSNLVVPAGWICDKDTPVMIQGSWYSYGDGSTPSKNSMCTPAMGNPCGANGCCMSGATIVDMPNYTAWGCGIGMELSSSGGTSPTKSVYAGPVKCFNITMTGNSGGNPVRIGFSQSPTPAANAVSPYTEIPAFTNGWNGQVCFADVTCPSWAVTAGTCTKGAGDGTPVDMQIQIPGGDRMGTFGVCLTKVEPVVSTTTGTGGTGGGTNACASPSGSGTINTQFGDAHVTCPKEYIVQSNAWGQMPFVGQTITFGPGAKLKVTAQSGSGTSTPAGYPSIWTGAYDSRNTNSMAPSGLPRAVSQITAGSLMTSWTWADNGAPGSFNATYDVWFSTSASGDPANTKTPSAGFLMVWFYKPSGNSPIGATITNGSVMIGGKQFSIWYGLNNGKPCVSYVAQQKITSWTFSLGDFIVDALGRTCTGTTKCLAASGGALTTVFSGFEIWNGGVGLETKDFGVTVP